MPKLLIDGTEFELSVEKYERAKYDDWLDIRLGVKNDYMDFSLCEELLQKCDVDEIIKKLEALIYGRLYEVKELDFIEPDITMKLYPAHLNVSNKRCIYRGGHSTSECRLDITLHMMCADEEWKITLDRDKISELLNGLKRECGKEDYVREYIGLVGVSFIGNWTDIHWYRYDGDKLWSQKFVKVEHDGREEYAMVEYVRKYDTAHLPCKLDDLKYIKSIVPDAERNELADKWEDVGYIDGNKHALQMILSDGTVFTIEKKTHSLYRLAVRNEYINYEKTGELFTDENRQDISDYLSMLVNGDLREMTAVSTVYSDLSFAMFPKGAKVVREWCEFVNPTDIHGNRIDERYSASTMKIDIDLCRDGVSGRRYYSLYLNERETEQFATQWAVKVCKNTRESEYVYYSVSFDEYAINTYYYRADDDVYRIGDKVIVPVGREQRESVAEIVDIEYFDENELPMALEKVKKIIRKADKK